jgi:sugar/nucleoside kinase (ribokinase family)
VDDLSGELAKRLLQMKQTAEIVMASPATQELPGPQPSNNAPTIFLAETTPDLDDLRDNIRRYLDQANIRVLPEEILGLFAALTTIMLGAIYGTTELLGIKIGDDAAILEKAGRDLLARTDAQAVLVTRGSRGMALFQRRTPTIHIPIFGSDQIADVTGAGDTVMATMTLALASGGTFEEAARLANYAGGLVVMKRGTAVVTARELKSAITGDRSS